MSGPNITIPDHIQLVGETGHFYTVVAVENIPEATTSESSRIVYEDQDQQEDEADILVCGKCKCQFSDVDLFLGHKKTCKKEKESRDSAKTFQPSQPEVADTQAVYYAVDSNLLTAETQYTQLYIESSQLLPLPGGSEQIIEKAIEPDNVVLDCNSLSENLQLNYVSTMSSSEINENDNQEFVHEKLDLSSSEGNIKEVPNNCKDDVSGRSKNRKIFCTYCHKGFSKNFDLAQHVRSHTGEKPYQCVICGRGFAQKSNVKKHMITHKVWPKSHKTLPKGRLEDEVGKDKIPGEIRTIETKESYMNNKQHLTVNNCYECPYCQNNFPKYPDFKSHLKEHQVEKCYRCIVKSCGQMFQDLELFLEHTSDHKDKEYRCHVCSKKFIDLNQLNLHSYEHLTDEQTREKQIFQCSKCKNKYTSVEALDHHLDTADHSFTCDICDKEFSAERFLRKHLAITHTDGLFECHICKKKLKNEHYLKSHLMIHTGELPFECKECGAKFNRNDKLKRHAQTHNPSKKYKCPFKDHMNCTKEFHRFDKLKLHIMTHGNIKPFKCDICTNGFSRKEHLNTHIQKIHLGGKGMFKCIKCDEKFDMNSSLQDHIKLVHEEEKSSEAKDNQSPPKKKTMKKCETPPIDITAESKKMLIDTTNVSTQFEAKTNEYKLPEKINAAINVSQGSKDEKSLSSAKSLETYTMEPNSRNENSKQQTPDSSQDNYFARNEKPHVVQSAVGSAASEAMEILYSGASNLQ